MTKSRVHHCSTLKCSKRTNMRIEQPIFQEFDWLIIQSNSFIIQKKKISYDERVNSYIKCIWKCNVKQEIVSVYTYFSISGNIFNNKI